VVATLRYPNPYRPWTSWDPVEVFGSGTVIEGKRILTNSHLVLYATDICVQGRRGGGKVEAKVEALAPDMDLALLSLADDEFFQQRPALRRARRLPMVQDTVVVYGFPVGGNDLAVTKGVISRIDFGRYYQQGAGLIIQVSAAVNPGNSGGPAVVDDRMVGIVFGQLGEGENIGYIVPNEEIDVFLGEIDNGCYEGKHAEATRTQFQRLENKALRSFLKLDERTNGVLAFPPRQCLVKCPFQQFDVLTKIGSYDIDNEGMVQLPNDLRISFQSLIPQLAKCGVVPLTIVRNGQRLQIELPVSKRDERLISEYRGQKACYFIHGPLVFSPAKAEALDLYFQAKPTLYGSKTPLITRRFDHVEFPDEELVVVTSPMFAHRTARGYADPVGQVLTEVNGLKIRNLSHLVETLRDCRSEFLTFSFAEQGTEVLVFRRDEMETATSEILEENGIAPARRASEDMLRVWQKNAAAWK
jgi:hypothetical protein